MRAIDGDAFAEFLKDAVKQQKYEEVKIDGLLTVADVIEAVISELDGTSLDGFKNAPTIEPELHWIPCSERLPEENGEYLTTMFHKGVGGYFVKSRLFVVASVIYKGMKDFWLLDGIDDADMEVIAWMPLPEPYKEETDD